MADSYGEEKSGGGKRKSASFWHKHVEGAKEREKDWRKKAEDVEHRYLDERQRYTGGRDYERRVNILWSTTETLKSALFAQLGQPDVRRQFPMPGRANMVARTAAVIMERSLVACNNRYDPEGEIEAAISDYLIAGRGQCWLEYEADVSDDDRVIEQRARIVYVNWPDFLHGNGKCWSNIRWVGRRHYYTKQDLKRDWPEDADDIPLNYDIDDGKSREKPDEDFKRAIVYEIWDRQKKQRIYIAEGFDHELERQDDPYQLENFFPCPEPLYAVRTTGDLVPTPEFTQWEDQATELDRIHTRIWRLIEQLKYCGVYDGSNEDDDTLKNLGKLQDGEFIPHANFAELIKAGGLAQIFQVRELQPIATAIQHLTARADRLIEFIYELTGISDIARGSTDPRETAKAQEKKAQFGAQRLDKRRREIDRFIGDLYRMKAEVIAEHFTRERLEQMSGVKIPFQAEIEQAEQTLQRVQQVMQQRQQQQQAAQQAQQQGGQQQPGQAMQGAQGAQQMPQQRPQPVDVTPLVLMDREQLEDAKRTTEAPSWEEVRAILRSDDRRNYNVQVETDISALGDQEQEKQSRLEFTKVIADLMERAVPAAQGNPAMGELMKETVLFVARSYKVGRTLEETLEDAFDKLQQQPAQGEDQDPLAKLRQQELQLEIAKDREDLKHTKQKHALELQKDRYELQQEAQEAGIENTGKVADIALEREKQKTSRLKEMAQQNKAIMDMMEKQSEGAANAGR